MKVLLLALFFLILSFLNLHGQEKTVCFTIDDLPVVAYGVTDTAVQAAITRQLVSSFHRHGIPAIGFVNGRKAMVSGTVDPFQREMLNYWLGHGMELGNHTFSHPDFNKTPMEQFGNDILRGGEFLEPLLAAYGKELRYFRHPFLRLGQTRERADSLARFLSDHGYLVAPVTMDNDDYLFASAFAKAVNQRDTALKEKIGVDYLVYLDKKIDWYEGMSDRLFGRQIAQIFLFHASMLNAVYIGEIISVFARNGYRFSSLDEALRDPAYTTEITVYGKYGISWLDRWAMSAGKTREFFAGEPEVPGYIVKP